MKNLFMPKEKTLEKKTKELIEKQKKKDSILEKMLAENPQKNPVFTAMYKINDPKEMEHFYQDYVTYLKENGANEDIKQNPEQVAKENIRHIASRVETPNYNLWVEASEKKYSTTKQKEQPTNTNTLTQEVQNYLGNKWKTHYNLDEYGTWEVRGEDPNCDMGGHHHEPLLGTYEGKYSDVLTYATQQKSFYTWGAGGSVKKVKQEKIGKIGKGGVKQ